MSAAAPRKRGALPWLAAGCALVALCVVCAGVAGGGYYFYSQRPAGRAQPAASVEYILDATQRMGVTAEGETDTRLNVARGVLAEIVRPADPALTAGLRVFGSGAQAAACADTTLLVPLAPASQGQITTHLLSITSGASAEAAMSQAIIDAIRDLAGQQGKHALVVVTGGADSCSPQAGALIAAEAQKAGIDFKLFVVGYQVAAGDGDALKGLVDGSGGNYVNADTKEKLHDVLVSVQQFVQDQNATTVSNVMGTAAASVGTQNVIVGGTPGAASTRAPAEGTPTPANTPSPAATSGGQAVGPGQTACDHPYFPMRTGATWTFSTNNGPVTWSISSVSGDQTAAEAVMAFTSGQATGNYNWQCGPAGIESYDFGQIGSQGTNLQMTVSNQSGAWLPPVDQLVPGATWDSSYTLQIVDNSAGGAGDTVTETFTQHFTLVGTEQHDVAGQSMPVLHIEATANTDISTVGSFASHSTYLFARGVGPVMFTSAVASTSSTSTLTSYNIP
jgi:hypothetical protein